MNVQNHPRRGVGGWGPRNIFSEQSEARSRLFVFIFINLFSPAKQRHTRTEHL